MHISGKQSDIVAVEFGKKLRTPDQRKNLFRIRDPAAEILEVVTECVFASLVGIVDNLAGRVELDEFLQPRAWVG